MLFSLMIPYVDGWLLILEGNSDGFPDRIQNILTTTSQVYGCL
ncbi:MAG: hypothetical protein N3E48_00620 [Candidatus Bathyarchaeota archaeon]|nr:hypothetical protein [Candidatus Bathyarchaeota archaeon]